MFFLRQPADERVRTFLSAQAKLSHSYPAVGASRGTPPPGFVVDHNRIRLGAGEDAFARAVAALRRWETFHIGWVRLLWPDAAIEVGTTVAVQVRLPGVFWLNACRIVYTIDEDAGGIRRYGFAYGTLPDHAESGEERFSVEWRRDDDSVWYDILAFSRPNHILARLGYPVTRALQKRFARDSKQAMLRAAGG